MWSIIYEDKQPFTMEKVGSGNVITLTDQIVLKSRQMLAKLLTEQVIKISDTNPKGDGLIELILRG